MGSILDNPDYSQTDSNKVKPNVSFFPVYLRVKSKVAEPRVDRWLW